MPRAPILAMVLPGKHPGHRRKYIELIYTTVPQPVLFQAVEHNGVLNSGWLFTFVAEALCCGEDLDGRLAGCRALGP
jgi:hypothetical protein